MSKTTCKYCSSTLVGPCFADIACRRCFNARYVLVCVNLSASITSVICLLYNRKMREFVPIDIYKTSQQRMIEQGLTPGVANRIWTHKALWLICTHKEDIKKVR